MKKQSKEKILELVDRYINEKIDGEGVFIPGETYVRNSGAVWDADDVVAGVNVLLEGFDRSYTEGKYSHELGRYLATFLKQRYVRLCNSGSSANLLAMSALMSDSLGKRKLNPGDEVITVAAGFPTTVNPIIQNGLVPVFVDIHLPQYNALPNAIEEAVTDKTRAIFIAHTLGNPFKAKEVRELADRNELWVIADCCDALGAEYDGQPLPFWADMSTFSFYPAHHISIIEGGAVSTNNPMLDKIVVSLRDWGRDCWCDTGKDNTCGKRYGWQLGGLPAGFDHKFTYRHVGYNLKTTDVQAAMGIGQVKRLPMLIQTRNEAWEYYRKELDDLKKFFILPEATANSTPSWFGFLLTVKNDAPFTRKEVVEYLEKHKIGTRMLFAGNLTKQPAYQNVKYHISGVLKNTDDVMNSSFWFGVFPGVSPEMRKHIVKKLHDFCEAR